MKNAFLAVLLITPLFGLVGTMVVNNKMSFFSDALGHSALTGIAIGVLLGVDNYLLSMLGFALLFALCISAVMSSGTSSADTILGVFSSTGLALGVVLLSATGGFAKYSSYLIGDILTVQPSEIGLLAIVLAAVLLVWVVFFNRDVYKRQLLAGNIVVEVNQLHPNPSLLGAGAYAVHRELEKPARLLTAVTRHTILYSSRRELA